MLRDYLFHYFASQAADGTIQMGDGFSPTDVHRFPKHPLSPFWAAVAGVATAIICSLALFATNKLSTKSSNESREKSLGVGSLFFAVFLDSFGAFVLMPFIGILCTQLGSSAFQTTCLGAIYAFTQFMGTFCLGIMADKFKKRSVLLWCLGMCSVCLTFSGMAIHLPTGNYREVIPNPYLNTAETASCLAGEAIGNKTQGGDCYVEKLVVTGVNWAFLWLLALRALAGFFGGTVAVVQTIVAERSNEENRTENIAMVMGYFGVGTIAGPFIGGISFDYGIETLCYVSGALTLVNTVYAKIQLADVSAPREAKPNTPKVVEGEELPVWDALGTLVEKPFTSVLMVATFLATGAVSVWISGIVFFNLAVYQWSGMEIGLIMFFSGVLGVICQLHIAGPVTRALGDPGCIVWGNFIRAVVFAVYIIRAPWLPWCLIPLGTLSGCMIDAQLQSLMTSFAPKHSLGTLLGMQQSLRSLAEAVFQLFGGYFVESSYAIPMVGGGAMAAVCGALIIPYYMSHSGKKD